MGTLRDMTGPDTDVQDVVVDLASRAPGVKEAAEVVGRLQPHVPTLPTFTTTVTAYSTGGNVQALPQ